MCDFISWISLERNDERLLFYLTDREIFSEEGREKFSDTQDNDVIGHGAIDRFFDLKSKGRQHEVRDFWNTDKLPQEIADKIANFDAHWGKMFAAGHFQSDDLEYIINNGPVDWKEKAQKQLTSQKFKLIKSVPCIVPANHKHNTCLSDLDRNSFYYFNDNVTDKNFQNVTNQLIPGKKYTADFIRIGSTATSEECLSVYKERKALLVGAQGLAVLWRTNKEDFPINKWAVSFDEKGHLYKDAGGGHGVPSLYRYSDGGAKFGLGGFGSDWDGDDALVVFRDC
jgi:hypothetical protein